VFDHISKHLKARQKYSATRHIFNSLLGVWKCGQTMPFVFDILHKLGAFQSYQTFEIGSIGAEMFQEIFRKIRKLLNLRNSDTGIQPTIPKRQSNGTEILEIPGGPALFLEIPNPPSYLIQVDCQKQCRKELSK